MGTITYNWASCPRCGRCLMMQYDDGRYYIYCPSKCGIIASGETEGETLQVAEAKINEQQGAIYLDGIVHRLDIAQSEAYQLYLEASPLTPEARRSHLLYCYVNEALVLARKAMRGEEKE